jgi:hypothetical protein
MATYETAWSQLPELRVLMETSSLTEQATVSEQTSRASNLIFGERLYFT